MGRPESNSSASPTFQLCEALCDDKLLGLREPKLKMRVCLCVCVRTLTQGQPVVC